MFFPGSLDKSSASAASSETSSPGRSKFPVGINPVGDESQQNIRIQLAVHRYNNSTDSAFARSANDRSPLHSPFKHGLFKNTQKYKSFENDKEETQSNGLKKSCNHYEGVGNFPVVHLKKNTIISKPIKRNSTNEFRIQLPELPLNRFLSESPNVCLDTKTSTRSVLDVLQDLSRKRIHTKDDPELSKRKCKGLGGDAPLDIEAPYKPLFVPKNKKNSVTLRDSTTQTQDFPPTENQYTRKKEIESNDRNDPKAELRRKLARQNNEIFASLSSSTLSYPIKRNSEKISQGKDHIKEDEPSRKKTKYCPEQNGNNITQSGGTLTNLNGTKTSWNSADSSKVEKKPKAMEGTKVSPGKDRLTNIFLEIQNINPKVEVLKNRGENEKEDSFSPKSTGLGGEKSPNVKEFESKVTETETVKKSAEMTSGTVTVVTTIADDKKTVVPEDANVKDVTGIKEPEKGTSAVTTIGFSLPTTSSLNFGVTPSLKISVASTVSSSVTQMPIFSTGVTEKTNTVLETTASDGFASPTQKSDRNDSSKNESALSSPKQQTFQITAVGSGTGNQSESTADTQKPSVSAAPVFQFGIQSTTPSETSKISASDNTNESDTKCPTSIGLGLASTTTAGNTLGVFASALAKGTTADTPTFTFNTVTTTTTATSEANTSLFKFSGTNSGQAEKPAFQFGFNSSNTAKTPLFGSKPEEKPQIENNKLEIKASTTASSLMGTTFSSPSTTSAMGTAFSSTSVTSFGHKEQSNQSPAPFKFGDKTESPKPTTGTQGNAATSTVSIFGQKPGIFTFGQKPIETPPVSQSAVSQSGMFQLTTTSVTQPSATQPSLFQQTATSVSQPTVTQSSLFQQTASSVSQPIVTQSSLFQQTATSISQPTVTQSSLFQVNSSPSQPVVTQPSLFQQPNISTNQPVSQSNLFQQTNAVSQSNVFQPSTALTFGQKANTTPVTKEGTSLFGQSASTTTTQANMFQQNPSQPSTTANSVLNTPSPFGVTSQSNSLTKPPAFMQNGTGGGLNNNNNSTFGQNKPNVPTFGKTTTGFGQEPSAGFSTGGNIFGSSTAQNTAFPQPQQSAFGSQPFGDNSNKQQGPGFFMQPAATQASAFGQTTGFGTTTFGQAPVAENNVFGQKQPMNSFDQNRNQPFGQAPAQPAFASQTPFTFGSPASSSAMNPQSSAPSVFTFGGAKTTTAQTPNFGFNAPSSSTASSSAASSSSPFQFNNPQSSPFKFGAPGNTPFAFNATPSTSEMPKSAGFNFGATQATPSSNTGYNFGAGSQTPSTVFSFGSNSASSSGSNFTFGASPANTGGMFTPGATPSPSTQVPVQGMFSIGSGSSQPRSRSSGVRARRRT